MLPLGSNGLGYISKSYFIGWLCWPLTLDATLSRGAIVLDNFFV